MSDDEKLVGDAPREPVAGLSLAPWTGGRFLGSPKLSDLDLTDDEEDLTDSVLVTVVPPLTDTPNRNGDVFPSQSLVVVDGESLLTSLPTPRPSRWEETQRLFREMREAATASGRRSVAARQPPSDEIVLDTLLGGGFPVGELQLPPRASLGSGESMLAITPYLLRRQPDFLAVGEPTVVDYDSDEAKLDRWLSRNRWSSPLPTFVLGRWMTGGSLQAYALDRGMRHVVVDDWSLNLLDVMRRLIPRLPYDTEGEVRVVGTVTGRLASSRATIRTRWTPESSTSVRYFYDEVARFSPRITRDAEAILRTVIPGFSRFEDRPTEAQRVPYLSLVASQPWTYKAPAREPFSSADAWIGPRTTPIPSSSPRL